MKKCDLCGDEIEVGERCPNCGKQDDPNDKGGWMNEVEPIEPVSETDESSI